MSILGLSRNTIYNLIKSGAFPVTQMGRSYIIPKLTFDRWMQQTVKGEVCEQTTEETLPEPSCEPIMEKKKESQQIKNVRQRGKTWSCIYYVVDPRTGLKKPKWKGGFKTQKEAEKAQRRLQSEADMSEYQEPSGLSFQEYAEKFLEWKSLAVRPNTVGNYTRALKYTEEIDKKTMSRITYDDIVRVYKYLQQQDLETVTVHDYMSRLRTIFTYAEKQGDIRSNPFRRFVMPPLQAKRRKSPTELELHRLLKGCEDRPIKVAVILALTLGLRLAEVCGLRFGDFNFEKKQVTISRQIAKCYDKKGKVSYAPTLLKTESSLRTIGVPDKTLKMIKDLMEARENLEESPYVIAGQKDVFIRPNSICTQFAKIKAELGLTFTFHDLRHAYGTICQKQNIPLNVIKDAMGHSDIGTTANIYIDTEDMMHLPAKAIDNAMNGILY